MLNRRSGSGRDARLSYAASGGPLYSNGAGRSVSAGTRGYTLVLMRAFPVFAGVLSLYLAQQAAFDQMLASIQAE